MTKIRDFLWHVLRVPYPSLQHRDTEMDVSEAWCAQRQPLTSRCVCANGYIYTAIASTPRFRAALFFYFLFFSVVSAGPGQVVGYPVLLLRQRQAQRQAEREQAQVRTPCAPHS